MFRTIQQDDITVRNLKTHKNWNLTNLDVDRYYAYERGTGSFNPDTDEKSNGVYSKLLYSSIKTQYYYNPTTGSALDPGLRLNQLSEDERVLNDKLILFKISRNIYGEGIKPGSVTLTDLSSSLVFTDDSYSNLRIGDDIYGNVFYEHGVIVMTKNITSSSYENVNISLKSTQTIYEHEIFITVPEGEGNVSTNPTAIKFDDDGLGQNIKNDFISLTNPAISGSFDDYFTLGLTDPTGSYLRPYITTIGLYDDNYDLLAVAKLARPVKKLPDFPLSFIIRMDF